MSKEIMRELAKEIESKIGKQYGFALLVYEQNTDSGRLNYVSNSNREDVVKMMVEFIEKTKDSWGTHKL